MAYPILQPTTALRHARMLFSISDNYLFHKFHFQLLTSVLLVKKFAEMH